MGTNTRRGDNDMVKIVHWQNVVGKDYAQEFEKTTVALVFAKLKDQVMGAQSVLNKLKDDDRERYDSKRGQLRRCGYEEDGKIIRRHGWYMPYLDKGQLRFNTTADLDREYISMNQYIEWNKGMSLEDDINRYYDEKPVVKYVLNEFDHEE